ncbi:MAG: acetyl-CoA carboxylase biotin carboxyl carrier protein, partial [Longimicrobiales bacterium]
MDLDFVRGLIEAVDQSSIDTLEMNREGIRIRISKSPPPSRVASNGVGGAAQTVASAAPAAGADAPPATVAEPATSAAPQRNLIDVPSPMVGTFYRAPAPEAPP